MKRKIAAFLIIVFWLALCAARGQTPTSSVKVDTENTASEVRQKNLKKFADSLSRAFADDDYEKLADLLFIPKDFADADSDEERIEKELALVKHMIEQTKIAGMKFTVRIKSPRNIIGIGNKLFSIVPQKTIIVVDKNSAIKDGKGQIIPGGRYQSSGYLLAVSNDEGESWRFWNEVSKENLEREFPETTGKIKLPEIQKPYFLR